jgi:hypothetical protein
MMADFMAPGPDDVSAHLADDAHRLAGHAGEARWLAGEDSPGESHANVAAGGAGDGGRDERLADFAQHRCGDSARPNAWHVMVLSELTGAGDRCPGATDDEALGLMGRWKAAESWAAARKLGVAREMIRRRAVPEKGMASAGLPWEWEPDLQHEVAAELRTSLVAAGKLLHLAWSLEARLPRIGDALADGRLDPGQAKMIVTETDALPDDKATEAEELIMAGLGDCHTWAGLLRLVQQAVVTVDPDGARRRREQAERETARVRLWRESSGASALAGHALPTDEALAAWGHVEARAQHYRAQGIREYIDLLRVMAYLDLLNGVPAEDRITQWTAQAAQAAKEGTATAGTATPATRAGGTAPAPDAAEPAPGQLPPGPRPRPAGTGPGNPAPSDGPVRGDLAASGPLPGPELRAKVNLTIPMGTATGHGNRPGEAWDLGALDPALARQLLAAAARSPGSEFCVTVTDDNGYAVGHGCCRPASPPGPRKPQSPAGAPPARRLQGPPRPRRPASPAATVPARPADSAHGRSPCPAPAPRSPWTSSPCPPTPATTPTSHPGTTPAPGSATSCRSATGSARSPPADATPANPTSSTPPRMRTAGRPAPATATPAAGPATRSSNDPDGASPPPPPAGTSGPPQPAAPTPKDPGNTPPEVSRRRPRLPPPRGHRAAPVAAASPGWVPWTGRAHVGSPGRTQPSLG